MSFQYWLAAVLAALVFIYLLIALFRAEDMS